MSKHSRIPQIIVALSPQGELVAELPGHSGSRRQIPLSAEGAGASLLRMLRAQSGGQSEHSVGLEGSPTSAQIEHWERHADHPKPTCQFCLAEGACAPQTAKRVLRAIVTKRSDGVEIKLLQPKGKNAVVRPANKSIEEFGL